MLRMLRHRSRRAVGSGRRWSRLHLMMPSPARLRRISARASSGYILQCRVCTSILRCSHGPSWQTATSAQPSRYHRPHARGHPSSGAVSEPPSRPVRSRNQLAEPSSNSTALYGSPLFTPRSSFIPAHAETAQSVRRCAARSSRPAGVCASRRTLCGRGGCSPYLQA